MSNILVKPFKASQKILRAIFKGSPNLFTTSDMNRQIEALSSHIRKVDNKLGVGVVSDMEVIKSSGQLSVKFSYIELWGLILYSGISIEVPLGVSADSYEDSIFLWYTTKVVTYTDDPTHEISGVKFSDGTSKPAADHEVINEWGVTAKSAIPNGARSIKVIADVRPGFFGVPLYSTLSGSVEGEIRRVNDSVLKVSNNVQSLQSHFETRRYRGYWQNTALGDVYFQVLYSGNVGYIHVYISGKSESVGTNNVSVSFRNILDINGDRTTALEWLQRAYQNNLFFGGTTTLVGVKSTVAGTTTVHMGMSMSEDALLNSGLNFTISDSSVSSLLMDVRIPYGIG